MKKLLKVGLIILLIGVAGFFIAALAGPKNFEVSRTKTINAPAELVYEKVSKFSEWKSWSPWIAIDPTQKTTIEGEEGELDCKYSWESENEEVGNGSMTITAYQLNKEIQMDLDFTAPFEAHNKSGFTLKKSGEMNTELTWYVSGDFPFMARPFMLMQDMEKVIGSKFEEGLNTIAEKLEF